MKDTNHIIAAFILLGALSCAHLEEKVPELMTFQAVQGDALPSKTVLQSDGSIFWSPGDEINMFYKSSWGKFTSNSTEPEATTSFSGSIEVYVPNGEDEFWAVYPYHSQHYFDHSKQAVNVILPDTQGGVAGTFNKGYFISMAKSKDYSLSFYNLCGGIKFCVSKPDIEYVTFQGKNNEVLAGQVKATFDENGKPVVKEVVNGQTKVRLNAPEGGFVVGEWYYIVTLPTTLTNGYSMSFYKSSGFYAEREAVTSVTIKRSVWGRLTDAEDAIAPISPNNYLTFSSEGTTTISMNNHEINYYGHPLPVVYYSYDATTWKRWNYSELPVSSDKPLYICGNNPKGFNIGNVPSTCSSFAAAGDPFSISGDIMSLIKNDEAVDVIPCNYCFCYLFADCQLLISGPELSATTLTEGCYSHMFAGCTSLSTAPELPATKLAPLCYGSMFDSCRSLTEAPDLPATKMEESCYYGMFGYCSILTKAPALPATELENNCYMCMFVYCTSLTNAPELPATNLKDYCYYEMFQGCSSLTEAPELAATTLSEQCYFMMFNDCTSLITAPRLPATTLTASCYYAMFEKCSSLTSAPTLPATTLADYCYQNMFSECTSLTEAPELPATTLAEGCYSHMFTYCASLTEAPELPAPVLTKECYLGMFGACTALNYVKCLATDISAKDCLNSWLSSVPSTGTFVRVAEMNDWTWGTSGIPQGWVVLYDGETSINASKYLTFSSDGTTTISYSGSSSFTPVLYYSFNATDWTRWDLNELTFSVNEPLYLCGDNLGGLGSDATDYRTLTATGDLFSVSGDIMSLVDRNADLTVVYGFPRLFSGCTLLKEAPSLPATKLAGSGYCHMFDGCTNLVAAPELPATALSGGCYESMFEGCTSLTTAPELPAEKLEMLCYMNMFKGCTSLTQAPALPALTMMHWCYESMFEGCTSLVTAPELPATQLAERCYEGMFAGCTSLTATPELPATKMNGSSCYCGMFSGCTNLTTAPALPATTLTASCYAGMFTGCTKLTTTPELPATAMESSCYRSMFDSCTSLRVAPSLPATTLSDYCYTEMFAHCSNLQVAPELPATTLAYYCYGGMFWECTSLTTAPELPASTLATSSYSSMFKGCTNLNYVKCLATDVSVYNCINEWLSGVSSTGTFVKAANAQWPTGVSGIPEGWTVEEL